MTSDRAEPTKHRIGMGPDGKLRVDDLHEFCERREVSIVEPKPAEQFPAALNRIELRAVGRKEAQDEVWALGPAPSQMEVGVMILGVVHDDDDATPAGTPEVAQEAPTGFGVKAALRFGGDQPPVTDADGAKATDALARRRMVADRIAHLGWHPHSTAAAVLLERDFVHRPQIDVTSFCQ